MRTLHPFWFGIVAYAIGATFFAVTGKWILAGLYMFYSALFTAALIYLRRKYGNRAARTGNRSRTGPPAGTYGVASAGSLAFQGTSPSLSMGVYTMGLYTANPNGIRMGASTFPMPNEVNKVPSPSLEIRTLRRPGGGIHPHVDVPVMRSQEPVQAWKLSDLRHLKVDGKRRFTLLGVYTPVAHPVEGRALCLSTRGRAAVPPDMVSEEKIWRRRMDALNLYRSRCGLLAPDSVLDVIQDTASHPGVPGSDCTCGFYAWKSREQALQYLQDVGSSPGHVVTQVELFGTVFEYTYGYRAEYQRVLGLYLPDHCSGCGKIGGDIVTCREDVTRLCVQCQVEIPAIGPDYEISQGWSEPISLGQLASELGCEVSSLPKRDLPSGGTCLGSSPRIHAGFASLSCRMLGLRTPS